jgi:hypothetical protein
MVHNQVCFKYAIQYMFQDSTLTNNFAHFHVGKIFFFSGKTWEKKIECLAKLFFRKESPFICRKIPGKNGNSFQLPYIRKYLL